MADDLLKQRAEHLKAIWQESKEREAQRLAAQTNTLYINLKITPIETSAIQLLDEADAKKAQAVVFDKLGKKVSLATTNPHSSEVLKIIAQLQKQGYEVKVYTVTQESLDWGLSHYRFVKQRYATFSSLIDISETESVDFSNLHQKLQTIPANEVTQLVNILLKSAVEIDASDIHIEPQKESALVRFRIDGVLYEVAEIDKQKYHTLTTRLKMHSGIKIDLPNIPQNGRCSVKNKDTIFDVRSATIPSPTGEFFVFRLLNPIRTALGLEDLGLRQGDRKILADFLSIPNGMILVTGPTGSGKTTTLYTLLKQKISPGIKIITIEDPIEYQLPGISQTQVTRKYDFASGLKAILRQDPDVVLVGEIRDSETATTAANASLTGHLVLSTLHTNEASGTPARLKELGLDNTLMGNSLKLIIAQRLVRKLCPYCREQYVPSEEEKEQLLDAFTILSPKSNVMPPKDIPYLYKAKGCEHCHWLGYKGQIGIFELLPMTSRVIATIEKDVNEELIRRVAIDEGMTPLFHDGLLKVIEGATSLEEIVRVAGDIDYIQTLYKELFSQALIRGVKISPKEEAEINEWLPYLKEKPLSTLINGLPKNKQIGYILAVAYKLRATDVHFEKEEQRGIVRQRIDGVLHEILDISNDDYPYFINEIKSLAGLRTDIVGTVQEGRFRVTLPTLNFDIRLSILPAGYGEAASLRILGGEIVTPEIENLGFLDEQKDIVENLLKKKVGLIISAGPTSSGKTTTLFAFLKRLNQPGIKIITVEDPIEYRLPGVIQTQVNEEKGYTFATALRTLLRQNPNIFLIGEIRDSETAQLVWQASLTGHLVLSTIHANNSLLVFERLKSLGIPTDQLGLAINGIISQRLVRKLCPQCKQEEKAPQEATEMINKALKKYPNYQSQFASPYKIYKPVGCAQCGFTGYQGLTGVFEILIPQPNQDINKIDFPTLYETGAIKMLLGITSWEEIKRVLG